MKKIYVASILTLAFLFSVNSSRAQFTGGTYATVATGGLVSDPNTWVGMLVPPFPCVSCLITINGPVTIDTDIRTEGGSEIKIASGAVLDINGFVQLLATDVIVMDNATVNVNDEVHLFNSTVRLANTGSVINANNAVGNPSHGTVSPGDPSASGLYYSLTGGSPPMTSWDLLLSQFGYGGPFPIPGTNLFDPYKINCNFGTVSDKCFTGFVYGPAVTQFVGVDNTFEFVQTSVLPVILAKFSASLNPDKTVAVSWTTTEEINSDYFSVERSGDATHWQSIGTVKSRGNSSGAVNYQFTDPQPLNSVNYYRLQMVDLDGKYKYSKVAQVSMDGKAQALVIYNNPFRDQIRLKVNITTREELDLKLTDMLGRTYLQQKYNAQAGDNFINLTPARSASGVYILSIRGRQIDETIKLIKQ